MKNPFANQTDESLREVLREWSVTTPLTPRFQDGVWRRIDRAEEPGGATLWECLQAWLAASLRRPAMAVAYASVMLAAGLMGGYLHAQRQHHDAENGWRAAYFQSVDPWQAPART